MSGTEKSKNANLAQDQGPPNTLYYISRDVVKVRPGYQYK